MSRWLLALVLTAAAPLATADNAVAAIDACIPQLDAGLDVGYARIESRCPDLVKALARSPVEPWLPSDWRNSNNALSADGLKELRALLTRQPSDIAAAPLPRIQRVSSVLASIGERRERTWWEQLKDWIHDVLTRRPATGDSSWLGQWFDDLNISQTVLRIIAGCALALVVALAISIVVNELRVVGGFGVSRRRLPAQPRAAAAGVVRCSKDDFERADLSEQPRLLLELVVARLREQERLPPARALTLNELLRAARLATAVDRQHLGVLSATCEQQRFAAREVSPPMLAAALTCGRELLSALERPVQPEMA